MLDRSMVTGLRRRLFRILNTVRWSGHVSSEGIVQLYLTTNRARARWNGLVPFVYKELKEFLRKSGWAYPVTFVNQLPDGKWETVLTVQYKRKMIPLYRGFDKAKPRAYRQTEKKAELPPAPFSVPADFAKTGCER